MREPCIEQAARVAVLSTAAAAAEAARREDGNISQAAVRLDHLLAVRWSLCGAITLAPPQIRIRSRRWCRCFADVAPRLVRSLCAMLVHGKTAHTHEQAFGLEGARACSPGATRGWWVREKATAVECSAWLPVGAASAKTGQPKWPSATALQRTAGRFISALAGPNYWHRAGLWLIRHHLKPGNIAQSRRSEHDFRWHFPPCCGPPGCVGGFWWAH